jgi:uncharacterized protein YjiS (DUF1127 family)
MAHVTEIFHAPVGIADRLSARIAEFKNHLATRAMYRATVNELDALSDRELADLGISRGSIRHMAQVAAYGN